MTPNVHVVLMLKRACRHLFYYGDTPAWDPSEKIEYDEEAMNVLYDLMGEDVEPRKEFIFNKVDFTEIKE